MHADSENCHSIRCAHTPHTGGDEATNLSAMPDIPRTHRHLASKRVDPAMIFLHFDFSFPRCLSSNEFKPLAGSSRYYPFLRLLEPWPLSEWQFLANRDYKLAISHRFSHELERFPVEFREYVHHLYRWVLRAFCGASTTDAYTPPGLTLAISFSASFPPTVSATASREGRFAIAVSSSVATT